MERTQVNNNSNFITVHSMKYLQAQKTYETYLQHLIETKLYLSETNLSYHKDRTTCRPLNKVEPCFAGFVPGWVTKNEYPVW